MATIGTAFNIATGALDADQAALDIVANNTANVNTPGYTLETPTWEENDSASLDGMQFGMGVQETGAQSQRDRVLEQAMQQQTQTESSSSARLTALDQMQAMFSGATSAGTDTSAASGIGSDLSNFFDSLSSLEASPADDALRQNVLSAAGTLASDFNGAAAQLEGQRQSLDEQSTSVAGQANTLLRRHRSAQCADRVDQSERGCGNAGGSAAAGPDEFVAADGNPHGADGEQRPDGDDDGGRAAGLRGAGVCDDDGRRRWGDALFRWRGNRYHLGSDERAEASWEAF